MAVTLSYVVSKESIRADVSGGATVDAALRAAGVHPETVLVVRGRDPLPGDAPVVDGETLELLRVSSGG